MARAMYLTVRRRPLAASCVSCCWCAARSSAAITADVLAASVSRLLIIGPTLSASKLTLWSRTELLGVDWSGPPDGFTFFIFAFLLQRATIYCRPFGFQRKLV